MIMLRLKHPSHWAHNISKKMKRDTKQVPERQYNSQGTNAAQLCLNPSLKGDKLNKTSESPTYYDSWWHQENSHYAYVWSKFLAIQCNTVSKKKKPVAIRMDPLDSNAKQPNAAVTCCLFFVSPIFACFFYFYGHLIWVDLYLKAKEPSDREHLSCVDSRHTSYLKQNSVFCVIRWRKGQFTRCWHGYICCTLFCSNRTKRIFEEAKCCIFAFQNETKQCISSIHRSPFSTTCWWQGTHSQAGDRSLASATMYSTSRQKL